MFDSICITLLLVVCLAFYLVMIWFGVINPKEGTNPMATMFFATLVFGLMTSITVILIIKGCYEYWFLSEDAISSKRIFRKKVVIKLKEIKKVEKRLYQHLFWGCIEVKRTLFILKLIE